MYANPTANFVAPDLLNHVFDVAVSAATRAKFFVHRKFANQKAPTDKTAMT